MWRPVLTVGCLTALMVFLVAGVVPPTVAFEDESALRWDLESEDFTIYVAEGFQAEPGLGWFQWQNYDPLWADNTQMFCPGYVHIIDEFNATFILDAEEGLLWGSYSGNGSTSMSYPDPVGPTAATDASGTFSGSFSSSIPEWAAAGDLYFVGDAQVKTSATITATCQAFAADGTVGTRGVAESRTSDAGMSVTITLTPNEDGTAYHLLFILAAGCELEEEPCVGLWVESTALTMATAVPAVADGRGETIGGDGESAEAEAAEGEVDDGGGLDLPQRVAIAGVVVAAGVGVAVLAGKSDRQLLLDALESGEASLEYLTAEQRALVEGKSAKEQAEFDEAFAEPEGDSGKAPFEATKEVAEPADIPSEEPAKPPAMKLGPVGFDPTDKLAMGQFGDVFVTHNLGSKDTAVKIGGFTGLWNPDTKAWSVGVDKAVTLTGDGEDFTLVTGDKVFNFDDKANQFTMQVPGLVVQSGGGGWTVAKTLNLDANNQLTVMVGGDQAKGASLISKIAPNISIEAGWEQYQQVTGTGAVFKTHTSTVKLNVAHISIKKIRGTKPLIGYNTKF